MVSLLISSLLFLIVCPPIAVALWACGLILLLTEHRAAAAFPRDEHRAPEVDDHGA